MPIIWIARLLGLPIAERVAGADILDALRAPDRLSRRLDIFLFGGAEGIAAAAAKTLNEEFTGLKCVGTFDPGFGEVEEMSRDYIIDAINSSNADFLMVSLGAKKGQRWLQRNHSRLSIPIRSHLGATINFLAGTINRAPPGLRAWGLEWAWRIKEEPKLWRRYWNDGLVLLQLIFSRAIPLAILTRWHQLGWRNEPRTLLVEITQDYQSTTIGLIGDASEQHVAMAISHFR